MTAPTVTVRRCTKCGETKGVDGFDLDRSKRDGLNTKCKECKRAYNRAYRESRREEVRAYGCDQRALIGNPTMERYQEITDKHATRTGEPWSEAEEAYLAASTDRIVDDALALKRTYMSVMNRIQTLRARGVTLARDAHRR